MGMVVVGGHFPKIRVTQRKLYNWSQEWDVHGAMLFMILA